jgi:site-specific DNA-methyltransferase (adenine-specific)
MSTSKHAVHFSSESDDHGTPQDFFDTLNAEFRFGLDVCAAPHNCKVARYFDKDDNGLKQDWRVFPREAIWCNPPYGDEIVHWCRKAYMTWKLNNETVVMLLPARTDTHWFQTYILPYAELRFVAGRLKFEGSETGAPFPSVVAIFRSLNQWN